MAVNDAMYKGTILRMQPETTVFSETAPVNTDTLVYLEDGQLGVRIAQEMFSNRAQTNIAGLVPRDVAGPKGAVADFRTELLCGDTILTDGDEPSGGYYVHPISCALGWPISDQAHGYVTTSSVAETASGAGTSTTFVCTGTAASVGAQKHVLGAIEDADGNVFVNRQIITSSASTFTINRATDPSAPWATAASDIWHPFKTWAPHLAFASGQAWTQASPTTTQTGHPLMYAKRRSRAIGSYEGSAYDFAGIGLTLKLEQLGPGMRPMLHFTGRGNSYIKRTPEDSDISALICTTAPPVMVGSTFVLGTSAYYAREVDVDFGMTLSPMPATSGSQGRQTWAWEAAPPTVTATLAWDEDWFDAWYAGTLYNLEFSIGANSDGTDVTKIHGFAFLRMPAAQIVNIEETNIAGYSHCKMTFKGVQSQTTNETDLAPIYFGIAGKGT